MPVLEVNDLKKHFPVKKGVLRRTVGQVYAVDGISFAIGVGETLGLVGESGCGKTTAGRAVLRLIEPTAGSIEVGGTDITHLSKSELRPYRRQMQIIFQDPFSSLNPRMTAGDIVGEPLLVHGVANRKERGGAGRGAVRARRACGRRRWPTTRTSSPAASASASASPARWRSGPKLIVGDEPVSALDVSIQAQVINLLQDLQRERQLSYLFISHNLAVVEHISHHIAVMYLGRIVEHADTRSIFTRAAASLYRGAAVGRAGARPRHPAPEAGAAGRRAEPGQSALGLPLPHPLPLCRGALQGRVASAARNRAGASRFLPSALELAFQREEASVMAEWDYVIVGGGSAGCVLANRLTEDPNVKVLLLEAGPRDKSMWIDIPAGFTRLLNHKTFNWNFEMEAEEGMAGRRIPCPRGRTLGRLELDQRHALRARPAARLRHLGPARQSRLVLFADPALLQEVGEFRARRRRQPRQGRPAERRRHVRTHELCDAFIDAAAASGYPKNKDYNNGDQEGFGYYQVTMKNGKRQSTARAFLDPVRNRPNLKIETDALVRQGPARGQARGRRRLQRARPAARGAGQSRGHRVVRLGAVAGRAGAFRHRPARAAAAATASR